MLKNLCHFNKLNQTGNDTSWQTTLISKQLYSGRYQVTNCLILTFKIKMCFLMSAFINFIFKSFISLIPLYISQSSPELRSAARCFACSSLRLSNSSRALKIYPGLNPLTFVDTARLSSFSR